MNGPAERRREGKSCSYDIIGDFHGHTDELVELLELLGYNEYWLQDQSYENPGCLGLGKLDMTYKERRATDKKVSILCIQQTYKMYHTEAIQGHFWNMAIFNWSSRSKFSSEACCFATPNTISYISQASSPVTGTLP